MNTTSTSSIYFRPRRTYAVEAAVVAALALTERAEDGPVSPRVVANVVLGFFPWSNRTEVHRTLRALVGARRVRETIPPGRSLPAYSLP